MTKTATETEKVAAPSLQDIIDASPSNIYWKNLEGVYLGCNKATLQYMNLKNPEDFIGKTNFELFDFDCASRLHNVDTSIMTRGKPKIVKEADSNGNIFLSHKSPLRNHNNEVVGIIGNSINITAQQEETYTAQGLDFEDLLEYKATYNRRPKEDLSHCRCILPISVGQPQHEGTKFKAALKLVNSTFQDCTIVVCDSLHRHSLAINTLGMSDENLYKLSIDHGSTWIARNQGSINQHLTAKHQILRWDHWLHSSEYVQCKDTVDQLYANDPDYKQQVDTAADHFVQKLMRAQTVPDRDRAIKLTIAYLKEESAIAHLWDMDGYEYIIYPGMNQAITETLKRLNANILHLPYRLNSKKSSALSFQNIIDASPAHIYWKDLKGAYMGCNKATLQCLNLHGPEDIIGKTDFDILNSISAKNARALDLSVMTTGTPRIAKEIDNRGSGSTFLSYKSPLRNYNNEIIGIIGNSINITAQEKAEQKLKQRTKDLAAALEAKERFLRNMSHEIRTPLTTIMSIPESLKAAYDTLTDKERKSYIDDVIAANNRLLGLVSNLLDLSKYKEGKFTMELQPEDIRSVVENVINEFKYSHGNITLEVDTGVPANLACDSFRVGQVIRNLIGNSVRYGGIDKPIVVKLSNHKDRSKQYVKCTIKDEGVGIPNSDKEAIFDVFVESSKTKSFAGGTGLGLSIAKEIVEAHKGRIWVEDLNEGETGARISFTLLAA